MTADLEIYRSSPILLRERGDQAPIPAAMRANAMALAGDIEGYEV